MILDSNYYTDLFGTDVPSMESLIATALSQGGDYADLFFESTSCKDLQLRDGEVTSGGFHVDFGVGIRVLKGDKTGYAYSESTRLADMMAAAKAASAIAQGAPESAPVRTHAFAGKPNPAADRYPFTDDWRLRPADTLAPLLESLEGKIRAKDSRVIKVLAMLSGQVSDVMMFNSHGELKYDTRPMGTLAVSVIYTDGKTVQNSHVSRSFRCGAEMLTDALLEEIATKSVAGISDRLQARRPKGGKMPVVMGAGASGILLHEAMGHAFEADFNRKGQSVFSDRMGTRVCPAGITIVDDATLRGNRGSLNFDDEGVPGQRTCMVEDGILTSFLHDKVSAAQDRKSVV